MMLLLLQPCLHTLSEANGSSIGGHTPVHAAFGDCCPAALCLYKRAAELAVAESRMHVT